MQNTKTKILTALGVIAAAVAIAFLAAVIMAYPVKWLWNWLVPGIFGLRTLSALEAWGLTLLLQLLLPKGRTSDKA